MRRLPAFFALLLVLVGPALAVDPAERLADPALEARARQLSGELRCLVCQNQSIDESDAALARDLRVLVRERVAAGDSDAQVLDYLTARYGDFVLLKPRFAGVGLALWLLPPALLAVAAAAAFAAWRRRRKAGAAEERALSGEEERTLAALMAVDDTTPPPSDRQPRDLTEV